MWRVNLSLFPHSLFISSPYPLHFLVLSPYLLHFLSISSFSLLFLFIFSFSLHFLASRMQGCSKLCNPVILYSQSFSIPCSMRAILSSGRCTNCQWTVDIFILLIVLSQYHIHVPLYFYNITFTIPCNMRAILSSGRCTNCQWTGRWGVQELLITGKAV